MKKGLFLILVTLQVFSAEEFEIHVLDQGETLSEILQARGYTPLYGEDQWVEKTLKMNHLSSIQDKKIKKGFPIILPSKGKPAPQPVVTEQKEIIKEIYKEKIVYKKPKGAGWLSGLISEHQDVFLNFAHNQNTVKLPNTTFEQNESFTLGLHIEGKNRRQIGKLTYDFNTGLEVTSQGTARFSESSERSVSLEPNYNFYTQTELNTPQLEFNFGPGIKIEEKSRVFEIANDELETRRDRTLWVGFSIFRDFDALGTTFEADLSYNQSLFQANLDQTEGFNVAEFKAQARVQLTNNYFAGLQFNSTQYANVQLQSEQKFGFNFRYLIQ